MNTSSNEPNKNEPNKNEPNNNEPRLSTLSDKAILKYKEDGEIIIEPFNPSNLNTSSYDVTLGEYYFRETHRRPESSNIYNMYSSDDVTRVWGKPHRAKCVSEYDNMVLENIKPDDKIIFIEPGETILAHANEFIGGVRHITTMMKSRSSLGRNFIEVCKCAGWGDVGYTNRWTLEITNNSRHYTIPLVVGRRVAQIVFFDVGETNDTNYSKDGKYQTNPNLTELQDMWEPDDMLPKMYKDFEVEEIKEVKVSKSVKTCETFETFEQMTNRRKNILHYGC